ncbi:hypothetical protein [Labrys neptuniae]
METSVSDMNDLGMLPVFNSRNINHIGIARLGAALAAFVWAANGMKAWAHGCPYSWISEIPMQLAIGVLVAWLMQKLVRRLE